jgi:hypothetical protein
VRVGQPWVERETVPVTGELGYVDLALVDVELFVSSGVPRRAFTVLPEVAWWSPTVPKFRLSDDTLLGLGWQRDALSGTLQPAAAHEADHEAPHPYALGPVWTGANCWRAEVRIGTLIVVGLVDHRWATTHSGTCALGDDLASGSPWRWHVVGLESGAVCGRAETPVQAAFCAEAVLVASGARILERTVDR